MLLLLLAAGADPSIEVHLTSYDSSVLQFRSKLAAGAKASDIAEAQADMEVSSVIYIYMKASSIRITHCVQQCIYTYLTPRRLSSRGRNAHTHLLLLLLLRRVRRRRLPRKQSS
jgi:hypothetical protein